MIRISLGLPGSGKTISEVMEMCANQDRRYYSNIKTSLKHQKTITPKMIIKEKIVDYKKNKKTGNLEPVIKRVLNVDYWKRIPKPVNVILDEAHSIINSRRAMSATNIIMGDWLALVRRVIGSKDKNQGELVLITQLPNRIDITAREMATQIRYHICWYNKKCLNCGRVWTESTEYPIIINRCVCGSTRIKQFNHQIEIIYFKNMGDYYRWHDLNRDKLVKGWEFSIKEANRIVGNVEQYFKFYDTLQWDNLFGEFYN